ncbi:ankyrin-1-like [Periplaneta americana]|uniref:ankyrin-1-like n=1 Tax=Periplaneta americana TaxID=6978 RepID=UPI0037E8E987
MFVVGHIIILCGCFIADNGLVLNPVTPDVVRIKEGNTLTLEAYVESEESNLWFFGPGNIKIGNFNQQATITRDDTKVQLEIWGITRFQSGVYFLKGFDVWSNEKCNWTVIVQVVPEHHARMDSASDCISNIQEPEVTCAAPFSGEVTWEYSGCKIIIKDADQHVVNELDQCGEFSAFNSTERARLLSEAASRGDIVDLVMLMLLGTPSDGELQTHKSPLCIASREGHRDVTQFLLNADNGLVLNPVTPDVVRIKEGNTLTLEAYVESEENNLWFFGPGNIKIGNFNQQATITRDDTKVQLEIWGITRFQSGVYFLKGFDVWSNEKCNWTVIVQVVPEHHVRMDSASDCISNIQEPEVTCAAPFSGEVTWEYSGCKIIIKDADQHVVNELDQCGGFSAVNSTERARLLSEAASRGDIADLAMLMLLGTPSDGELQTHKYPLCIASREGHRDVTQFLLNAGANASAILEQQSRLNASPLSLTYKVWLTPLHCAALSGSVPIVQMMLATGVNMYIKDSKSRTPFMYAAQSGSLPLVKAFLSWGAKLSHKDSDGATLIFHAARSGSVQLVKFLISLGEDPLSEGHSGLTALFYAARSGSLAIVEFLVSLGADPLKTKTDQETPIFEAVNAGSIPLIETFLKWGASVNSKNNRGQSLLHMSVEGGYLSVAKKLIAENASIMAVDHDGKTPLHYAARLGYTSFVLALIDAGASTELSEYSFGMTPLHIATENGHLSTVNELIKAGAELNTVDRYNYTPLHTAVEKGNYLLVQALIKGGANPNSFSNNEDTPIFAAADNGNFQIFKALIVAGANYSAVSSRGGFTTVHYAAVGGNLEILQELIKLGAYLDVPGGDGKTPLQMAAYAGHFQIFQALIMAGANVSAVDKTGNTMLHFAAYGGNLKIVLEIITLGANSDAVNDYLQTPVHVAAEEGHLEIVKALINAGACSNTLDKNGKSPLDYAERTIRPEVIKWLSGLKHDTCP